MRKAANRVRITGQLIDATTGAHLWAERFEGTLDDIFELQDQVAASVVGAIAPQLERAEIERAQRTPTTSLNAYDCYLRGIANVHQGSREAISAALPLFHQAIELDPEFASAYGMAAWCYFWRKVNGWMTDRAQEIAEGARLARRAVELGRDDAVALTRGGHALGHLTGDLDAGIALLDRAVVLNPNLAAAWFLGGFLRVWHGETDAAIEHFTRAMRLSPLDPEMYRMQAGNGGGASVRGALRRCVVLGGEGVQEPAELSDGGLHHRGKPCAGRPYGAGAAGHGAFARGSIPRCASPISRIGCRSTDRKISRYSPMACERQACRNDSRINYVPYSADCARSLIQVRAEQCA